MDAATIPSRTPFGLVGVARVLLILNPLLFAYITWFLLPLDAQTPTLEHLRISAEFFAVCCIVAFTLGGWKALLLATGRGRSGPHAVAWTWLALFAGYGALMAASLSRLGP